MEDFIAHLHYFSSSPNAFCRKCGCTDPADAADIPFDRAANRWTFTSEEEERAYFDAANYCPVADDAEKHPWVKALRKIGARKWTSHLT